MVPYDVPSSTGSPPIAVTIVEKVADTKGVAPTELPPLYPHIEPNALEYLCAASDAESLTIEFSWCEYTVRVQSSRRVRVLDADNS